MKPAKRKARFRRMCWLFEQMDARGHPLKGGDAKWFTRNREERRLFARFAKYWEARAK